MFVFWVRKRLNGSENEFGMCPDERPGRGSGSVPRNLNKNERDLAEEGGNYRYLTRERASRTSSEVESNLELFDTICS